MTSPTAHRWAAIGNPYPSFLPANDNANATNNLLKQNISNLKPAFAALYFWNDSTGSYEPINHQSTSLTIAPGQAFLVNAKEDNATFTFPESVQTVSTAPVVFYKAPAANNPEITLRLTSGTDTKTTRLKYFTNTTKGLDPGYDAGTYTDTTPTFSIDTHLAAGSNGTNFTLQCLPNSDYETIVVPLAVSAAVNKNITFSAAAVNLPTGIKVFLEDTENQTITDITTSTYQINVEKALNGIGRFYMHTAARVLSIEDNTVATAVSIYKTSPTNLRVTSTQQQGGALVKMYTAIGKEVLSYAFQMKRVQDIPLPKNLAKGVYIVQCIANGTKQSKKLLITY
jgi:hypothetical protein